MTADDLRLVHRWLDDWAGLGLVAAAGMQRAGSGSAAHVYGAATGGRRST
jgi:hypothetical protein